MGRPRNFEADDVVDRAMEAFWTHGYSNTSPADLCAATGIGKGSLYNTFGSKRELFALALARYDRMGRELAEEFLAQPGSTREIIGGMLRNLVDTDLAQQVRRGCLVVNTTTELAAHDAEIARALHMAMQGVLVALRTRIEQGVREGDIRADIDPQATAEFFMNTISGLRLMAKTCDAPVLHRIIDTALTTL
ncbi:TetR/AcrR family transcriptional regulator [Nocardia sp. NPDC051030]|uniref:TetR/AcrR family transcriptional regulator n=1 Tax=Nocardia sp. NPDC051030 TaxID=3155162 RepID=UPI003431A2ED